MNEIFRKLANKISKVTGSYWSFMFAIFIIIGWLVSGPIFNYSDTWQLVINTTTTILTFLMVFTIQNTQNRDTRAIHLKLDELIKSIKNARNRLINVEEFSDDEFEELYEEFRKFYRRYYEKNTENSNSNSSIKEKLKIFVRKKD